MYTIGSNLRQNATLGVLGTERSSTSQSNNVVAQQMLALLLAPILQRMLTEGIGNQLPSGQNSRALAGGGLGSTSGQGLANPGLAYNRYNPVSESSSGAFDRTAEGTAGTGGAGYKSSGESIPTQVDYRNMSKEERRESSGMSDRERAVLHLWGIQMTAKGSQDGGVLMNVLESPDQFQAAEVELAKELQAKDEELYGGLTGKSLDQEFFSLYEGMTGEDISERYAGAPMQFAEGPVDLNARLNGENGLNSFENQVLQLWGHSPLFNQGKIDGNIIDYALNSSNTLESNLNRQDLEALKEADLASDGVINGDSLENAFLDTLDNLYLGGPGASVDKTMNDALQEASLRREGLLPPPEQGSGPLEGIDALQPPHPTQGTGGGQCPFLSGGA